MAASNLESDPERGPTFSLGAVARLTGLTPHVLRAWERRYGAVRPVRTPGGTRRYCESDVARLRLLRSAVQAGHAISEVAGLPEAELQRRLELRPAAPQPALAPVLDAFERLDGAEGARLLGQHFAALGAGRFVRDVAAPLLVEIGARWERGDTCIAVEHLASTTLRSLLGAALAPRGDALRCAPILFTTLPGDQHELGAMMAAVATIEWGGYAIFAGGNLPIDEIAEASRATGAAAVAVGVSSEEDGAIELLRSLRRALPGDTDLWAGGLGTRRGDPPPGVSWIRDFDDLERKVTLLLERQATT